MRKKVVVNINKDYCVGCTQTTCSGTLYDFLCCCIEDKEYTKEQVPETFEELKELCKGLKGIEFFYDKVACVEYININDVIAFNENGLMLTAKHNYDILTKKRTPQQMWQIIKSLIGEE